MYPKWPTWPNKNAVTFSKPSFLVSTRHVVKLSPCFFLLLRGACSKSCHFLGPPDQNSYSFRHVHQTHWWMTLSTCHLKQPHQQVDEDAEKTQHAVRFCFWSYQCPVTVHKMLIDCFKSRKSPWVRPKSDPPDTHCNLCECDFHPVWKASSGTRLADDACLIPKLKTWIPSFIFSLWAWEFVWKHRKESIFWTMFIGT